MVDSECVNGFQQKIRWLKAYVICLNVAYIWNIYICLNGTYIGTQHVAAYPSAPSMNKLWCSNTICLRVAVRHARSCSED